MKSLKELYRIGQGPSSSHTMGPLHAAERYLANNPTLRTLIAKAKAAQMPNDNIERAIKKGTGELESAEMVDAQYEAIKGSVAIVVRVLTDNKNRAAAEVSNVFKKNGVELAKPGSASRLFDKLGQIMIPAADGVTEDKVMEVALEAGAEDVISEDGGFHLNMFRNPQSRNLSFSSGQ